MIPIVPRLRFGLPNVSLSAKGNYERRLCFCFQPRIIPLAALEYGEDDEWVEITPSNVRLKKMLLNGNPMRPVGMSCR